MCTLAVAGKAEPSISNTHVVLRLTLEVGGNLRKQRSEVRECLGWGKAQAEAPPVESPRCYGRHCPPIDTRIVESRTLRRRVAPGSGDGKTSRRCKGVHTQLEGLGVMWWRMEGNEGATNDAR